MLKTFAPSRVPPRRFSPPDPALAAGARHTQPRLDQRARVAQRLHLFSRERLRATRVALVRVELPEQRSARPRRPAETPRARSRVCLHAYRTRAPPARQRPRRSTETRGTWSRRRARGFERRRLAFQPLVPAPVRARVFVEGAPPLLVGLLERGEGGAPLAELGDARRQRRHLRRPEEAPGPRSPGPRR